MGAIRGRGTMAGGRTPICEDCGVNLCWDISEEDYQENPSFWEAWICCDCNGGEPFTRKFFAEQIQDAA